MFPIGDIITLDDAGASITNGRFDQLSGMTRSTTALLQRVEGIQAVMLAHDTADPEELDTLENKYDEWDKEHDLLDEKHIEEEHENGFDELTDLPLNGDRLSRDKDTLAVVVTTNLHDDTNQPELVTVAQPIADSSPTDGGESGLPQHCGENAIFSSLWNQPREITTINIYALLSQKLTPFLTKDSELRDRILYNTTNTGHDAYADGMINSFILWLCGSQTDLTRNTQFDTMLPEYTQFKSVDSQTVNKFLGCNLDQYVTRRDVYGKEKKINNATHRDDVFDVVAKLGYTSYSVEKIIYPLLTWLQTMPVTQCREVIGSDGKFRAFTRGQIMTVCQECPDYSRFRKLGDMYFENTVDYYVQLMAIRDVHKYFRQVRVNLSLKPLNGDPSAKNMCPSRGVRS
jgi:hypothetical protein